jgi:hypothetical protein
MTLDIKYDLYNIFDINLLGAIFKVDSAGIKASRQAEEHLGPTGAPPRPMSSEEFRTCANSKNHCNFIRPQHPDLDPNGYARADRVIEYRISIWPTNRRTSLIERQRILRKRIIIMLMVRLPRVSPFKADFV